MQKFVEIYHNAQYFIKHTTKWGLQFFFTPLGDEQKSRSCKQADNGLSVRIVEK